MALSEANADALAASITAAQAALPGDATADARQQATWRLVYAALKADADVVIPATPLGDGLQVSTAPGNPTVGPAAPMTLAGALD